MIIDFGAVKIICEPCWNRHEEPCTFYIERGYPARDRKPDDVFGYGRCVCGCGWDDQSEWVGRLPNGAAMDHLEQYYEAYWR